MKIDIFSPAGAKMKTLDLPDSLFGEAVNRGLMHQAVLRQQGNRRRANAHVKTRGEVQGSTKKLFSQKHTGRARRGAVRSPLLRGGGKTFGPRNNRNFSKDMPKSMRHAALRSCLGFQAKQGAIVGLASFPDAIKTKDAVALLGLLPVESGRRILFVTAAAHKALSLSTRNIPRVKTVTASYLNPEDVLAARFIIFLEDAIAKADALFGKKSSASPNS